MGNLQLEPGTLVANRFELIQIAGSGGMGTVYRAQDRYSGETVALKLLDAYARHRDDVERFTREATLLSSLRHPGIVAYVAHGQSVDGQCYLAMEWLAGQDLSQRLRQGALPYRECIRLLEQVAEALAAAHKHGVVHRDIKPANLFLVGGELNQVKVLDFGIARQFGQSNLMTRTGMLIGTPEYMSPEQARGQRELTPAVDIFALGCVLYECLVGQSPFHADHVAAVLARILFEAPPPLQELYPGLPLPLHELMARMLAKDPELRLRDAGQVCSALSGLKNFPDPALAQTVAQPSRHTAGFAAEEQSLLCVVLAGHDGNEVALDETTAATDDQHNRVQRELLTMLLQHGSTAEVLADGTLLVVGAKLDSAQDQATIAARSALLIRERWPDAVVAVATGYGLASGRTAVGNVVERAAQLRSAEAVDPVGKPTAGIRVDALTQRLLDGRFAQVPQTWGAVLLHEEREVDATRPLLGQPTPCVGRETELAMLEAQLTGCIEESEARLVLITAVPGVGKSRLCHEYLRRVQRRHDRLTVLQSRADMMKAGSPYGVVCAALLSLCGIEGHESLDRKRQLLADRIGQHLGVRERERVLLFIGELCNVPFNVEGHPVLQAARQDPRIMRDCLRRAVLDFIAAECEASPVLTVFDDLQWGDELSVSLLEDALREQAGSRLFILSFSRPEALTTFPSFASGPRAQRLALQCLSRKACQRLIVQVLGKDLATEAIQRVVEQSGGNALFLEELIRSLAGGEAGEGSDTVQAMLQARIGRMDSGPRRSILAASIFGQTFWQSGVMALLGVPHTQADVDAWISTLVNAELVASTSGGRTGQDREFSFRHALVRDAAAGLLTAADRVNGHRLAASYLQHTGKGDAALIAEHYECGGVPELAAQFYVQAAEESLARGDYGAALAQVDHGLGCAPVAEVLGRLRSAEGYLAFALNRNDRLRASSGVALQLLKAGSLAWCRAVVPAITEAQLRRDEERALQLLQTLLATEPEVNARTEYLDQLVITLASVMLQVPFSWLQAITKRLEVSTAQAQATEPTVRRFLHSGRAGMCVWRQAGPWTLVREAERAVALHEMAGDRRASRHVRAMIAGWGWLDLGDQPGVQQRLSELETEMATTEDWWAQAHWRLLSSLTLSQSDDESDWLKAERTLEPMQQRSKGLAIYALYAEWGLAAVRCRQERWLQAEEHASRVMAVLGRLPVLACCVTALLLTAMRRQGKVAEAGALARSGLERLPILGGLGVHEVGFRLAASEALHAAQDSEAARAQLKEALNQIQVRAHEIDDPRWRRSYLANNPGVRQTLKTADAWGVEVPIMTENGHAPTD